jgi:hypothetical protein
MAEIKIFTDTRTKIPYVPSNFNESKAHKTEEILQQERNPPDSFSLSLSISISSHPGPSHTKP